MENATYCQTRQTISALSRGERRVPVFIHCHQPHAVSNRRRCHPGLAGGGLLGRRLRRRLGLRRRRLWRRYNSPPASLLNRHRRLTGLCSESLLGRPGLLRRRLRRRRPRRRRRRRHRRGRRRRRGCLLRRRLERLPHRRHRRRRLAGGSFRARTGTEIGSSEHISSSG